MFSFVVKSVFKICIIHCIALSGPSMRGGGLGGLTPPPPIFGASAKFFLLSICEKIFTVCEASGVGRGVQALIFKFFGVSAKKY